MVFLICLLMISVSALVVVVTPGREAAVTRTRIKGELDRRVEAQRLRRRL